MKTNLLKTTMLAALLLINQSGFGQNEENPITDRLNTLSKGLLGVVQNTENKAIIFSNLNATHTFSDSIFYYFIRYDGLIELFNEHELSFTDSMDYYIKKYGTEDEVRGRSITQGILDFLAKADTNFVPHIMIPYFNPSFFESEDIRTAGIFLEKEYPLTVMQLNVEGQIEHLVIEKENAKTDPVLMSLVSIASHCLYNGNCNPYSPVTLTTCTWSNIVCWQCPPYPPLGGIPTTLSSLGCVNTQMHELKIVLKDDACITNNFNNSGYYAQLLYINTATYWESSFSITPPGIIYAKKLEHPIRLYSSNNWTSYQDGEYLTLCRKCNIFDIWSDPQSALIALGEKGVFMLKRLNLQPLYFIIPNFQGFWYKSTPDTEFSFTDDTNGQLCGPVNFDIEQEYLFNDVSEFLTENIFNFGTDYIASTNRNFILDYWLNNVIMVGFTQGMIMVSVNDYLEFEAPFNNTFTPTGTKVYEFELFSNGKYEIKKDISPSYVLQPNDVVDIYVKAVYKNGEVIDGFIEHTLVGDGSQNTFNAVNIFLRGDIEDYDPNNTNYKIEIWKH